MSYQKVVLLQLFGDGLDEALAELMKIFRKNGQFV